jgi:hypothetical protein
VSDGEAVAPPVASPAVGAARAAKGRGGYQDGAAKEAKPGARRTGSPRPFANRARGAGYGPLLPPVGKTPELGIVRAAGTAL